MSDMTSTHDAEPMVPPIQEGALAAAPPIAPPTGDPTQRTPAQQRMATRTWCAFIFGLCAGMLGLALWLTPSASGVETHRQLGLPPCGWYLATGIPCPTCGCTTSVSYFAHGQLLASFLTHPFGFAVALAATLLTPLAAVGMITGRWMGPSTFTLGWYWRSWVYGTLAVLLVGWVYKVYIVRAGIHLP